MTLAFDFDLVRTIEFGVGRDIGDREMLTLIPVDQDVQTALVEIAQATWAAIGTPERAAVPYQPTEKYSHRESLYLPLGDDLAARLRQIHEAANLPLDSNSLATPAEIFCYFARLTDSRGRRLTGLRRATQFKGVLRSRLIRFLADDLKLIDEPVFKLDNEFDLLIDSERVHILRPNGFEAVGRLRQAILGAVPRNVSAIRRDLAFVDFGNIQNFASSHPRAARYLASIRSQAATGHIDKSALKKLCRDTGVGVAERGGTLIIEDDQVMGFLEVLDRRRYELTLVRGTPERFLAASRNRIDV